MKKIHRHISMTLIWVATLAAGLYLGRTLAPSSGSPKEGRTPPSPSRDELTQRSTPQGSHNFQTNKQNSSANFTGTEEERRTRAMTELSDILNTGNRVERTRQMLAFIDQIGDQEMPGIISDFQEAGWVDFNRSEYSMLISAWMDRDPFTAITVLDESGADGWTRKIAISAWATENPEAAANAIKGLEDGGQVNDWVVGLAEGMARNDPEGALATLKSLPNGDTKRQAIRGILPEVILRGPEFAGTWIEQIEQPNLQRETAKRLAHSLADRDPESASAWVENMTQTATRREASEVVSEIYASHDMEAAKKWTESLPQDTINEAAEGVTKHLARQNPVEAAQWLLQLGDSPDLDGARMRFLREAGNQDPLIALETVPTLSRADDQERYYRDILKKWRKEDNAAAIAWALDNRESLSEKVINSVVPKDQRPK